MRVCNTLTVEEMLARLRDVRARETNTPDTGAVEISAPDTGAVEISAPDTGAVEISAPDTAEGSEGAAEAYSLPEISELAGIPLYQLRYLRRRALLRSSETKDPFHYTPGEKHRVRVRISDLMDFLITYTEEKR